MQKTRGMDKVEFYLNLNEIKSLYDQGYVVLKILYNKLKDEKKINMSYWSFCQYAKKELIGKISNVTPINNQNILAPVAENKSIDEVDKVVAPTPNIKEEFKPDPKYLDLGSKMREADKI